MGAALASQGQAAPGEISSTPVLDPPSFVACQKLRAIIVPGNGSSSVRSSNWYAWLAAKLQAHPSFDEVVLRDMPAPVRARRNLWLTFMLEEMGADERTVVIGHSSGAVAALRLLETHKLHGAVLVSACHTDLGNENERASGYYPPSGGPWRYDAIMANAGGNIQSCTPRTTHSSHWKRRGT